MYVYHIGYSTCEESSYRQYKHEARFSKEMLEVVVAQAMAEVLKKTGVLNDYNGKPKWIQNVMPYHKFFHKAMKAQGFEEVKYEGCVTLFGWGPVDRSEGWDTYQGEGDKRILTQAMALVKGEQDAGASEDGTGEAGRGGPENP